MAYPIAPPVEPMLAKASDALPSGEGWLYEPKWDGFRTVAFRDGPRLHLQSRELKPLNRYFPEFEGPQLASESPASMVLFDLLALGDRDLRAAPFAERRALLERVLADDDGRSRVLVTPATRDRAAAADWFSRFEGAGLDGIVAKRLEGTYQPGVRAMVKVKHARTADCAVAGFRWHKNGPGRSEEHTS